MGMLVCFCACALTEAVSNQITVAVLKSFRVYSNSFTKCRFNILTYFAQCEQRTVRTTFTCVIKDFAKESLNLPKCHL